MKLLLIRLIASYLRRDRERAEAIIEATFPGFVIRKRRKDAGTKKPKLQDPAMKAFDGIIGVIRQEREERA